MIAQALNGWAAHHNAPRFRAISEEIHNW